MSDDRTDDAPSEDDDEALTDAWEKTVDELGAMVDAREEQGWDVLSVAAADVIPEDHADGETDRFGTTFVIPDQQAAVFEDTFRRGTYPTFEVYRKTVGGHVFLVVEYIDPEIEQVILVAGQFALDDATSMVDAAEEAGEFFSHHQQADGTHLGTFRHDSHEKFVPEVDAVQE